MKRRKKHACQDMPMPVSSDPSPKTPPPPYTMSSLESRLREIEERLGITDAPAPESPQAPAQVPEQPDYRRALEVLSVWTDPACWTLQGDAEEKRRTTQMLVQLHGYVLMALAGQEVPGP